MTRLEDALLANVIRRAVMRLRAHVEVADVVPLSICRQFSLISMWCKIGFPPTLTADLSADPWDLLGESIRWLNPTDWISMPVENCGWVTIRSSEGFAGLRRALSYPTNDLFIIQGSNACAVMDEEYGLELFDSAAGTKP